MKPENLLRKSWHRGDPSDKRHCTLVHIKVCIINHNLLSLSGLAPWRVPAGDVVAGQLPGRGSECLVEKICLRTADRVL